MTANSRHSARANPFASPRRERELPFDPAWCGANWVTLLDQLESNGWQGTVIGPHGSGKTTFLDSLKPRLEKRGFEVGHLVLNNERSHLDGPTLNHLRQPHRFWLVDGSERLGWWQWQKLRRLSRLFSGFIVTCHRLDRVSLPPLLLRTRTSREMLAAFIEHLAPGTEFSESEIDDIFETSGGNLREALWACYDRHAGIAPAPSKGSGTALTPVR